MACPEGLEPPTYCLEGSCSILLSYGHIKMERMMRIELTQSAWEADVLPLNYTRIFQLIHYIINPVILQEVKCGFFVKPNLNKKNCHQ